MTPKIEIIELVIPTYQRGADNPYPPLKFGRKRGFYNQYPYCLQDDIDFETSRYKLVPKAKYRAARLSNGILEAIVLPSMNGRLYSLRNVQTGREIFYRNNVVKPALVAMRGAWISGGIEFNAPSLGHSVSTVAPVFYCIENNAGECAITVGDFDRCTRQMWQVRMSLKSGRAALDITTTISNPNNYRERLWYWENAAVPVADDLRFLCNARWTTGRTIIRPWPLQDGIDKSRHINNPLPVDHFSYRQDRDIFGAFYEKSQFGTYHLAFRHQSSGQKYFTWGVREDEKMWEKFLTDTDGQYIEIQSGLYQSQAVTDWLGGGESVTFQGSWFGTENLGPVTWADKNVAVSIGRQKNATALDLFSIGLSGRFRVSITVGTPGKAQEEFVQLLPTEVRRLLLPKVEPTQGFELKIATGDGQLIFHERYAGEREQTIEVSPCDWVMEAAKKEAFQPVEYLEKYHFWTDALQQLRKKSKEIPVVKSCQIEAVIFLKTNQLDAAEVAIAKGLMAEPINAELHALAVAVYLRRYYLRREKKDLWHLQDHCLALRNGGKLPASAIVSFALAELLNGNELYAGEILASVPDGLAGNLEAQTLLAGIRRRANDEDQFRKRVNNISGLWLQKAGEEYLFSGENTLLRQAIPEFKQDSDTITFIENIIEWLLLYWRVDWIDDLLKLAEEMARLFPKTKVHPIFNLLLADAYAQLGEDGKARQFAQQATTCSLEFVFPHRWEDAELLRRGKTLLRTEAATFEYLQGLYLIENNRIEIGIQKLRKIFTSKAAANIKKIALKIVAKWEGLTGGDQQEIKLLQTAFNLGEFDWRLFIQLDLKLNEAHVIAAREKLHAMIPIAIQKRGDVTRQRALLLFDCNQVAKSLELLQTHSFNEFEGEARTRRLYVDCRLILGLRHFSEGKLDLANQHFSAVQEFPENLSAASYLGEHDRLARYMLGIIAAKRGDKKLAKEFWEDVVGESTYEAYVVEGSIKKGITRPEEFAARALAAMKLRKPRLVKNISAELISRANRDGSGDVIESAQCCQLMLDGAHQKAVARIQKAAIVMPCSALIHITELLVKLASHDTILTN